MNEAYQPINYDDYGSLGFAYQRHLLLTLALKNGEVSQMEANDLVPRRNAEYLVANVADEIREFHLDKVTSSSHLQIDTVVVSEPWLF